MISIFYEPICKKRCLYIHTDANMIMLPVC